MLPAWDLRRSPASPRPTATSGATSITPPHAARSGYAAAPADLDRHGRPAPGTAPWTTDIAPVRNAPATIRRLLEPSPSPPLRPTPPAPARPNRRKHRTSAV